VNVTVIVFALMAVVLMLIVATVVPGLNLKWPGPVQTSDSSLGPRSINWLAAIAFGVAVWICLV
jgi:hypothetical protein